MGKTARLALGIALVFAGCKEERVVATEPTAAVAEPSAATASPDPITEDQLIALVAWQREHAQQTNAFLAELEGATEESVVRLNEDHRRKMAAIMSRQPLRGQTGVAVGTVVNALATWKISPTGSGLTWEAKRDDAALADARKKYGDELVDWILAREHLIAAGHD